MRFGKRLRAGRYLVLETRAKIANRLANGLLPRPKFAVSLFHEVKPPRRDAPANPGDTGLPRNALRRGGKLASKTHIPNHRKHEKYLLNGLLCQNRPRCGLPNLVRAAFHRPRATGVHLYGGRAYLFGEF